MRMVHVIIWTDLELLWHSGIWSSTSDKSTQFGVLDTDREYWCKQLIYKKNTCKDDCYAWDILILVADTSA